MTWNFQHLELGTEKIPARRFFDKKIRLRWLDLQFETEAAEKFSIRNHRRSERVTADWTTELPLDPGDILHVIDVSVRQKQKFGIDMKRLHPFAGPIGSVKENPTLGSLKQIAICFENPAAKPLVNHRAFHCSRTWLQLKARVFTNI